MAAHDMVIDNAPGGTVRADLNNALAALVSNNSGTSAPGTTYAHMWWTDTTTNKLKRRNAANSAWIETLPDITATYGGLMADPMTTRGDVILRNSSNATARLAVGAANTIFGSDGTDPSWRTRQALGLLIQGLATIFVPALAMSARTTNGAASGTAESTTNKVMTKSLDFDQTTQEFAQFAVRFPKSWNEGTVTFAPIWSAASGSGGVVWALQGVALSDDDALDTAYGTEQTSTDTLIATGDVHVGPTSAAITIAGTPAAGDWVSFQLKRNVSDGSDTLSGDARLIGLVLFFTTDAQDDT